MKTATIQARLDPEAQRSLARLVRRLGWTPSKIVREGLRLLAVATPVKGRASVAGMGEFSSGIADLGSNKKHLSTERYHPKCVEVIEAVGSPLVT